MRDPVKDLGRRRRIQEAYYAGNDFVRANGANREE